MAEGLYRVVCPDGEVRHTGVLTEEDAEVRRLRCHCDGTSLTHHVEEVAGPTLECGGCGGVLVRVERDLWFRVDEGASGLSVAWCSVEDINGTTYGLDRHMPKDNWGITEVVERIKKLHETYASVGAMYPEDQMFLDDQLCAILAEVMAFRTTVSGEPI